MTIKGLIINAVFSLILFKINGLIGMVKSKSNLTKEYATFEFRDLDEKNFSGNFFHAVIHPAIFLAIASVILQSLSMGGLAMDLWLVVPLYWLLRFLHTVFWNRLNLVNWRYDLPAFITSVVLGELILFTIIRPLIINEKTVFINLEQFRDAFWFAAFTYLAKLFWDIFKGKTTNESLYPSKKKVRIIQCRYNKFHKKYNTFIEEQLQNEYTFPNENYKQNFVCLVYSVMIYEDHSRPFMVRIVEYILKILCWKCSFSLGIMQVQSKKIIGNKSSIMLAIKKLYGTFINSKTDEKIYKTISDYNSGDKYYEEVYAIYVQLKELLALNDFGVQYVHVHKRKVCAHK